MRKIYSIIAMLLTASYAYGQSPQITPVSPEAAALSKSVNYPVNLNTGIPSIEIPLYKIETGGMTLPITLNYHAGGFKINERSTNVGLGWSLSCDLQITRTINGLDDIAGSSTGGVGYIANTKMKIGSSTNSSDDPSMAYPLYDGSSSAYDLAAGLVDGMPDKFNYRLLNKSGSFYFRKDQSGSGYVIVPVPFDNLKISYDGANGVFTIVDSDGTVYTFGGSVATEYTTVDNNVTSWKCVQVANATNTDVISFAYQAKSTIKNVVAGDRIEYYNNGNPCALANFGLNTMYIRAGQVDQSIGTYEALTLKYPFYRLSSPRYIEYFGYRPAQALFHLPDLNGQNQLVDRTFTVNQGNISSTSTVSGLTLSSISFRGGSVNFSGSDQLNSITVQDPYGTEIRTFNFFQSNVLPVDLAGAQYVNGSSFNGTYYLDSIQIKNGTTVFERYGLQYKDKYCFGNHLSGKDAWGYPNDYTVDNSMAEDPAYYCNSCDPSVWQSGPATTVGNQKITERFQFDISGGCANYLDNVTFNIGNTTNTEKPSLYPAQHGILKRIIYPTGGFVDFDFESNKYKLITNYAQVVRMGGGLRVRSINYFDGKSSLPVSQKYYTYGDYEDGIGLLINAPSRSFVDSKYEYDPYSYSQTTSYLTGSGSPDLGKDFAPVPSDCYDRSCMTLQFSENKTTYLPASALDNTYATGAPIYYTRVTEYNSDLGIKTGKKVSVFYKPNDFSPYSYGPDSKIAGTNINVLQTDGLMGELKYIKDYKYDNGKYVPLHSKEYSYTEYSQNQVRVAYSFFNVIYQVIAGNYNGTARGLYYYGSTSNYYSNDDYVAGQYGIQVGKLLLSTETDKWYRSGDSTSFVTQYSYDANGHMQPSGIVTTNSKGEQVSKTIKYAYDFTDPIYVQMTANNMISQPIEEVVTNTTLNKELSRTKTNYGTVSIASGPTFISPISVDKSNGGNTTYNTLTYDQYDQYANVLQITGIDKQPVSYLWGYNNKYPIAEVKGATYSSVVNAVNATGVNINTLLTSTDETQLTSTINTVRTSLPNTLINSFTHKPLIGISSQTNPAGNTSYYEYDPFGRLKIARDQNNNILKKYDYQMLNSSSSWANTVLCANIPMMETYYGTLYDGTAASLSTNKLYNLIAQGGQYTTSDADGSNNLARGNGELDSLSMSISPANLTTISMTNWSPSDLPDPGYVHLDLIKDGSVVYSKTFPRDNTNDATHIITFTVPAGQYQVGLRQESNFGGAVLNYRLDSGSGSPTVFINTGDSLNLVSGQSYNLVMYNNYPH